MDPYSEQQQMPPRRSNGCLWGCLGTLAVVAVIVLAVFGYGAWYFYNGFTADSNVQTVLAALKGDTRAEAVLGKNIKILSVSAHTYERSTGRGGTATYVLQVTGSEGDGEVKAELDISNDPAKITLLILTGKDGQAHYLVGTPPPNPMMQNSI